MWKHVSSFSKLVRLNEIQSFFIVNFWFGHICAYLSTFRFRRVCLALLDLIYSLEQSALKFSNKFWLSFAFCQSFMNSKFKVSKSLTFKFIFNFSSMIYSVPYLTILRIRTILGTAINALTYPVLLLTCFVTFSPI